MMGIETPDDMLNELNYHYEELTASGNITKESESIRLAIDIIKKFQKIQKIVEVNDNDEIIGRQVREMIEDEYLN